MDKAKQYNRIKILFEVLNLILSLILLLVLVFTPLAKYVETQVHSVTSNDYLTFLLFLIVIGIFNLIITLPFEFYSSFIIEHKYQLSNQRFHDWILERLKSALVSTLIGLPIALVFFYLIKNYEYWWLILAIIVFIFSILLVRLAPTLIFPIFYKFTKLENEQLKQKITILCSKFNLRFEGIYSFNLSKNTKKANAGFTGIFKSKRIILSDTLIENFTNDEILTIFAHELGHYKKKHIVKNILIGLITTTLTFYITNQLYLEIIKKYEFTSLAQLSAFPILLLILSIISILIMPVSNSVLRKFEYEADEFAVKSTGDKLSFINSLEKLSKINLADKNPHWLIEFIFYSHPSIEKRIKRINEIQLRP